MWLHEIDPFFYERLVQRVDHLRDAQDQYDYVADGLDQPRKISHLYEARVIEAAKLRILAKRIRYEKLINDTTGSRQDRARQKWDETAEPLQNARDAVAFITSLRWHTRADSSNLRGDELLPDGRVYRDRRAYDPSMAKYILHDLQGQQKHEDETGQGLVDDEELHLDSPRVLKRLTDNFEAGVKKKDIEDLIDHFYGEFKGKVR